MYQRSHCSFISLPIILSVFIIVIITISSSSSVEAEADRRQVSSSE